MKTLAEQLEENGEVNVVLGGTEHPVGGIFKIIKDAVSCVDTAYVYVPYHKIFVQDCPLFNLLEVTKTSEVLYKHVRYNDLEKLTSDIGDFYGVHID